MSIRKLIALTLVLGLLLPAAAAAAPTPLLLGPCAPGAAYDPACDVDHDGDVDIFDIQKTAGHWNQSGTWMSDNGHTHLGQTWTGTNNALKIEGSFGGPDLAALVLSNSYSSGLRVTAAATSGLRVDSAGGSGLRVESSDGDGVVIVSGGDEGVHIGSVADNGVQVDSTGGDGISVGFAGYRGLFVQSTDSDGVSVLDAGNDGFVICRVGNVASCTPDINNDNGLEVGNAKDYGAKVVYAGRAAFRSDGSGTNAFYAYDAGDSGVWIRDATNWAGFFTGDINVTGNCSGCLIARMAVNSGGENLQPGDIVAVDGVVDSPFDDLDMLLRVRRATPGSPLVGVVSGRAEPFTSGEDGTHTLVPRNDEPAAPGEYLSVVIYGPLQVKASGDIAIGQRLTVDENGGLRALRRVKVNGVTLDEGGSSLGMALSAAEDGLVWVLVNPQ